MAESSRRVVITGLGAVTPIGNTVATYWAGLQSGANGVAPITLFDASKHACRFAAEVKDFNPSGVLDPKETKRWDRFCQFGVVAAKEALAHSGLEITDANRLQTVNFCNVYVYSSCQFACAIFMFLTLLTYLEKKSLSHTHSHY